MTTNPLCDCGNPSLLQYVRKEGPNQGREFYTCPSRECGFFQWGDTPGSPAKQPPVGTPPSALSKSGFHSAHGSQYPTNPPYKRPRSRSPKDDFLDRLQGACERLERLAVLYNQKFSPPEQPPEKKRRYQESQAL